MVHALQFLFLRYITSYLIEDCGCTKSKFLDLFLVGVHKNTVFCVPFIHFVSRYVWLGYFCALFVLCDMELNNISFEMRQFHFVLQWKNRTPSSKRCANEREKILQNSEVT